MKNPLNNISIFRLIKDREVKLITINFSSSGVARAFLGYSDQTIGKAGGYGYDKEGTCLQYAISTIYPELDSIDGASGWREVASNAEKQGLIVEDLASLVWRKEQSPSNTTFKIVCDLKEMGKFKELKRIIFNQNHYECIALANWIDTRMFSDSIIRDLKMLRDRTREELKQ